MDEETGYEYLKQFFHPEGLCYPDQHQLPPGRAPYDLHRAPMVDYRCRSCGAVFIIFTGTL